MEKTGLSQDILDQADGYVKIPMFGFSESFNISVSAALVMQSIMARLRDSEDIDWHLSEAEIMDIKIDWSIKTIQNGDRISKKYLAEQLM
jgi:tRNA (guanosine-2'-O-)-methyltransferase